MLVNIGESNAWATELMDALKNVRDAADMAKNPDVLTGINVGIQAIKHMATAPARAKANLEKLNAMDRANA